MLSASKGMRLRYISAAPHQKCGAAMHGILEPGHGNITMTSSMMPQRHTHAALLSHALISASAAAEETKKAKILPMLGPHPSS